MNLALGTVQFGLDYGISNTNGKINEKHAFDILNFACANNINVLDTAIAYGNSEEIIGNYKQHIKSNSSTELNTSINDKNDFKVITKVSNHLNKDNCPDILTQVKSSMQKLKAEKLYAVMLHNADELISGETSAVFDELIQVKNEGLCQKIGVSVYSPNQLNYILKHYQIDIVQIPLNILDQSFNQQKLIAKLKENNIEVHARSLFLQGLLLMDLKAIPHYFAPYKEHLLKFNDFCHEKTLTPLEACISFAKSMTFVDKFVVGVSSLKELSEILKINNKCNAVDFTNFSISTKALINPSLWPKKD